MANREDVADRRLTVRLFAVIALAVVVAGALLLFLARPLVAAHLEPGVGLKDAAVIAFALTLVTVVVMAIVAGEGLLGELQYMLLGFLAYFVVLWLLIAWVF